MSIWRQGRASISFALLSGSCLCATPAHAHLVQTGFGTFYDGVAHIFLTPADLLLVIGLGLLAGSSGAVAARPVLFALPAAWLVGCLTGFLFVNAGSLQSLTTFSFGLVGLLVALNVRLRVPWLLGLVVVAGLLHGFLDGPSVDWLASAGAAITIFALVALLAALVVSLRVYWARTIVPRSRKLDCRNRSPDDRLAVPWQRLISTPFSERPRHHLARHCYGNHWKRTKQSTKSPRSNS